MTSRPLLIAVLALTLGFATVPPAAAQTVADPPAAAQTVADQNSLPVLVEVTGRGWGHGRGLGQYGAQGYAVDHGWSSAQILDHFYGGTSAGPVPANAPVNPQAVRVDLRALQGQSLRVTLTSGVLHVRSVTGAPMWDLDRTARLTAVAGGIQLESGPSCDGPWTQHFVTPDHAAIDLVPAPAAGGPDGLLQVCNVDGSRNWYPGYLRFVANPVRTVNIVTIEEYLRGVVPNESPPSWHPEALKSQAVAARSYAMAGDSRQQPYADTCDTILCQVYYGYFRQSPTRPFHATTAATTDAAIAATAGLVRLTGTGTVARTEFSSSTGGYTAGGTFPAVVDDGDDITSNPNRAWRTVVDMRPWIDAQGRGDLVTIETAKNGLGPDGGRTTSVTFRFTGGVVTLSGDAARRAFGLKSDWMRFGSVPVQSVAAGNFVTASYQLFVRRAPSDGERSAWAADLVRGIPRAWLTQALARSDEWAGVMVDDLYRGVFGRSADPGGRAYWLGRMRAGLRFEVVAANFYGSSEYFARSGGTNAAFVTALYRAVLGRDADPGGLAYWAGELDAGRTTPGRVAAGFYASPESRGARLVGLYRSVLGRGPDPGGAAYWTDQLLRVDDVNLAAQLAASDEFFARAQG